MRARIESSVSRGGPWVWLAAAIWLGGSQAASGQTPAPAPGPSPLLGLTAGQEIPPEQIQQIYLRILADWSAGEVEKAPDKLIELETAVVSDEEPKTRQTLLQAENEVIKQVGGADLEVLVPIAVLHHEAYRRLLERGGRGHALAMMHTRTMAKNLALLYREQAGSEGAALVASRILTSLGGMLLKSSQQLGAGEMFQAALELDGRNTAAALALSSIYEKNAQYETAVKHLRRLVEADPAHVEGRFRLAMGLKRLDRIEEAQKILEELTASEDSSWVTSLAFQELARLHSEKERTSAAEKVLRSGLERFPQDARLHIQLAAVLDRRGEPGEAALLVEKVLTLPQGESDSARFLYNTVRSELFAESRSFLDENSRSRLPMLSQALGVPTGVGSEVGR
jgi:tetratricopeptide (TPR) repeat protein